MANADQMNTGLGNIQCTAITSKGTRCRILSSDNGMCKTHLKCVHDHGPHTFERMQLEFLYTKDMDELSTSHITQFSDINQMVDGPEKAARVEERRRHYHTVTTAHFERYRTLRENLVNKQREEIRRTGVNPDAEANRRKEQKEAEAEMRRVQVRDMMRQRRHEDDDRRLAFALQQEERMAQLGHVVQANVMAAGGGGGAVGIVAQVRAMLGVGGGRAPVQAAGGGGQRLAAAGAGAEHDAVRRDTRLGKIAKDTQSVHTKEVVRQTTDIVNRIRKIEVPPGYRWHKTKCSKTPGKIIVQCKLSQKAAWQMMAQYAQDTSIYDIEEGIYGKVLDSVWQFITNHAEKDSLVAILRTELEDNIGMCAQGNLTRICNIVSGYMDGVVVKESLTEILGRLLPPLRNIENMDERRTRLHKIFDENSVPEDIRETWEGAVME